MRKYNNFNHISKGDVIMSDFNTLKNLYEDGYRCIYYDKAENNHTIYLKNLW